MAINFPKGSQDFPFDANWAGDYGSAVSISTHNTWTALGLETPDITIKDTDSQLVYWGSLGAEVDGTGTGHGVVRVRQSSDSGSNWTTHQNFNVTGANDNDIGCGFCAYWDHDKSAGTTIRLKVEYLKNGDAGSNHTVADTGPGFSTHSRLFMMEVNS